MGAWFSPSLRSRIDLKEIEKPILLIPTNWWFNLW
jgi:hypothetical protein